MGNKREVRYVVSRLKDPDDPQGEREMIACHPHLDLAKKHADRMGPGTCVDAEGGTYRFDGPSRRRGQWLAEWTNRGVYQGRKKMGPGPEV